MRQAVLCWRALASAARLRVCADAAAPPALDEDDIALLTSYGAGPYTSKLKTAEADLASLAKAVDELCGVRESDTGLAPPSRWDLVSDKQAMAEEQPLQVCVC